LAQHGEGNPFGTSRLGESVFNDYGVSLRTTSLKCSYEQGTWKTGAFEQCGIQSEASNILIYVT